ncbi:MAG: PAS domain S-box protein [Desulfotignum sp.]|nr:PAS domain S-box protein [Desulfotignum sp.]
MAEKPTYEELETRVQELKTGYTQLEKKLHEAELFSEEIMTYMSEGFVQTDIRRNIIFINQRLSEMLGYLPEEIIGKCWLDIVPAEQQAIAQKAEARRVLGHTDRYEIILRRKDGHKFPVMIGAGPRFDKQSGEFIGTMGVVSDITERKLTEEALREKTQFLQNIIDTTSDLVSVTDMEGNFKFVGSSHSILGYDPDSLVGRNVMELVHPDDYQETATAFAEFLANREDGRKIEYRYRRADGEYLWFESVGKFILDDAGNPKEILFSSRDVTERKQAIEELKEREAFIKATLDNLPVGVAVNSVDPKVNFTYMNENFATFYRTTREALAAPNDFWEVVYTDATFREEIKKRVIEDCASNDPERMCWEDVPISRPGKKPFYITAKNIPLPERNLMVSTVWDVTERKLAEAEKEKLQSQLHQSQKMESVGRLAGGVAHDFNNMLGVILGHTELALLKMDEDNDLISDLKEILNAAKRSADITKQLLAFARKEIISPKQIDLNDTVASMLKMLRRLIGEDIDLVWRPGAHLWPVKMDPTQIDQILANLCVNARDAISGVGKLTIETGKQIFDEEYCKEHPGCIPGDFVMLAVSDNGCGIDKETLDNLFEPFFTTKEVGKGTGLGLPTIYGIVKQNNGFINVYSEPGQGSTFKIYLPRLISDKDVDKAVPEKKAAAGGTETILLVEDEPKILRMTRMMLERKGYTVISSATPAKAVEKAKNHSGAIDLLITDVVMPEMNGRDIARQITSLYPGIRLLFMSGYTANVIAHHGVLDDGVAFIQKPFSMAEMTAKVREVLDETKE